MNNQDHLDVVNNFLPSIIEFQFLTRMHSSRMRTAHLLTISQHALLGGVPARGCVPARGVYLLGCTSPGVDLLGGCTCLRGYLPRGCACPRECTCQGVYLPRGVPARGVPARGVPAKGGIPARGVPARGCTCPGVPAQVPLPVNRITDTCKNITLPQTSFAGGKNVCFHAACSLWCLLSIND